MLRTRFSLISVAIITLGGSTSFGQSTIPMLVDGFHPASDFHIAAAAPTPVDVASAKQPVAPEQAAPVADQPESPADAILKRNAALGCECCPKCCRLDSPEWRRMGCTLGQPLSYGCGRKPCMAACANRCCDPCCTCPCWLESKLREHCLIDPCSDVRICGWANTGYTYNFDEPAAGFNRPLRFNDKHDELQLNQLYMFVDRPARYGCDWDFGFRADLLYGTDYFFTQAFGLETHTNNTNRWNGDSGPRGAANRGLAMPQLYGEVFAPIGNGLLLKAGHFYSPMGYESVMAPANFFYSRSLSFSHGEPRTFTGLLASYVKSTNSTVHAGFHRGWDVWDDPDPSNGLSVLAGMTWKSDCECTTFSAWINSGPEPSLVSFNENMTNYSLVLTHQITDRLHGAAQHVLGVLQDGELTNQFSIDAAKFYGFTGYLFYEVSCDLTAGIRAEWFVDQDHLKIPVFPNESLAKGGNYYGITLGANWRPYPDVTIRPEIRWDWSDTVFRGAGGNVGLFDDFGDVDQTTFALDVIFTL